MAEPGRLRAALPVIGWAALIFFLSSLSRPIPVTIPVNHFDKVLHLGAYAVLGALAVRALAPAGIGLRRAAAVAVLASSLYGITDELHQAFVPGRDADPWDWAADTAGALLGAAAAVSLLRRAARASIRR